MAQFRRYAFLVDTPEGGKREYEVGDDGMTGEEAVQQTYEVLPDGSEVVATLRGDVSDDLDLSPEAYTESEAFEVDEGDGGEEQEDPEEGAGGPDDEDDEDDEEDPPEAEA